MADPYQPAAVVLGPIGLGEEIGRSLFGQPKPSGPGEPQGAGTAGVLLILGGVAIIMFALYLFASKGGARLFVSP